MIEHYLGNHGREMLEVRGHGALGDTAQVALKGLSDRLEHGLRPVYWNAVRDHRFIHGVMLPCMGAFLSNKADRGFAH